MVAFHQAHYHPGRAFVFTYGDIPVETHAAFLDAHLHGVAPRDAGPGVLPRQPRWPAPRRAGFEYQTGTGAPPAEDTFLAMVWLCGDADDPAGAVALQVLAWALLGHDGAPLRAAIRDSGLGRVLANAGYAAHGAEATIRVGLAGSAPESAERFERVILEALDRLAAGGLNEDKMEAAFRQAAYDCLEIPWDLPLRLERRAVQGWRLSGDPYRLLRVAEPLAACRARWRAQPDLFARLIRERLTGNPHRRIASCARARTTRRGSIAPWPSAWQGGGRRSPANRLQRPQRPPRSRRAGPATTSSRPRCGRRRASATCPGGLRTSPPPSKRWETA